MNLFYFLTPKAEVAYLYNDFTLRQALEKMALTANTHRHVASFKAKGGT